ncbi:MAG: phage GP46 family protein [Acetobacteraceae bacterium]|nr:phage GP46 family protein [Acetobacteraceae bacterium]
MTDIALIWNPALGRADIALAGPDLQTDNGLETAVILSLFTDRLADAADAIPDGSDDPRGWWGDQPLSTAPDTTMDLTGSRLWLLARARQLPETQRQAETYARESLAWMLRDGAAGGIDVVATFPRLGWLSLSITINQAGGSQEFNFAWQAT